MLEYWLGNNAYLLMHACMWSCIYFRCSVDDWLLFRFLWVFYIFCSVFGWLLIIVQVSLGFLYLLFSVRLIIDYCSGFSGFSISSFRCSADYWLLFRFLWVFYMFCSLFGWLLIIVQVSLGFLYLLFVVRLIIDYCSGFSGFSIS
jgi:hypothetical protein